MLIWWREPGTAEERHKMAEQDKRSPLAPRSPGPEQVSNYWAEMGLSQNREADLCLKMTSQRILLLLLQ